MHEGIERTGEKHAEQAADARQPARSTPQRQQAEREEGGDGPERFGGSERHKPVDQDAGCKGRQGAQQWMLPGESRWLRRGNWSGGCRECVLSFEQPIFI